MRVNVLGSGSAGNCTIIESSGHSLLVDAGFRMKEFVHRCNVIGFDPATLDAILLSHYHIDHILGSVAISNALRIPILASTGTLGAFEEQKCNKIPLYEEFSAQGLAIGNGAFLVRWFPVPHDAPEPLAFRIDGADGDVVAVCLDLGTVTPEVAGELRKAKKLVIEANYDDGMLRRSSRDSLLKDRVSSDIGHLSNKQVADFLKDSDFEKVVLAHLSQPCNDPYLAMAAIKPRPGMEVSISYQDEPTEWL